MSLFKKKEKKESKFKNAIDKRLDKLDNTIDNVDEDSKEIQNIKELVECKTQMEGKKFELNWNTVISGGFGILGLLMIIVHERDGVFSSKSFSILPISRFFFNK